MGRSTIVDAIHHRTGIAKKDVLRVLRALPAVVSDALAGGDSARVPGLGVFDSYWRGGTVVNVPNGNRMVVAGRHVIRVRAAAGLQRAVSRRPKPADAATG